MNDPSSNIKEVISEMFSHLSPVEQKEFVEAWSILFTRMTSSARKKVVIGK